jgi:transposase
MGKPIRNLSTVRRVGLDWAGSRSRCEGRDRGGARLGRITKMGDRYLRKLLVVGACATLRHRRGHSDALRLWASGMLERKTVKYKFNLTAVALANKVARIVFVLMTRGGQYDGRPAAA